LNNKNKDNDASDVTIDDFSSEDRIYHVSRTLDVSIIDDTVGEWPLHIKIVDKNGNTLEKTVTVKSKVAEFADWVFDKISGTVNSAIDKTAELASNLGSWIKVQAEEMISDAIEPIKEKIEGWASGVNDLLVDALNQYDEKGEISQSNLEEINEKFKYLYVAVFGPATAIVVGLNALMVFSGGVGSLSSLIVPVCVGVMMTQLFDSDRTNGREPGGIDSDMGIDAILDFSEDYLEDQMSDSNSLNGAQLTDRPDPEESWDLFWSGMSALFGWESFLFGGSAMAAANMDITGNLGAIYGMSAALFGVALGIAAMVEPGYIGYVAMIFGVESLVLSAMTTLKVDGGGAKIGAAISTGLAFISTYLSLKSLDIL